MRGMFSPISRWHLGTKLTLLIFTVVSILLLTFMTLINNASIKIAEDRATDDINANTRIITQMLNSFDAVQRSQINSLAGVFSHMTGSNFSLDAANTVPVGSTSTPALLANGTVVNMDNALPDAFTAASGAVATLFVRSGSDFIRVATSLRNDKNERVLGTTLATSHPAYASINSGKPYVGNATLFGRSFITRYDPIMDSSNQVIGIRFVGLDFSASAQQIMKTISEIKIGKTGYFFAIQTQGDKAGFAPFHPTLQDKSLFDLKDSAGNYFIRDIIGQKTGMMRYMWPNAEGKEGEKLTAFDYVPGWDWIIVGGTFAEEYTEETTSVISFYRTVGIIMLLIVGGILYYIMRESLSKPLARATNAAQTLSRGDLTAYIRTRREDEIGKLLNAMNGIGHGLTEVIEQVRNSATFLARSSREIAAGTLDLSTRTESQASALEETSAAMSELTDTVRKNSDSTNEAYRLASSTSSLAARGGDMSTAVMDNMNAIRTSSVKIVDIISLIDSIAFQTNILALNASVEAARAGEQGRGFAVVAGEVRTLSQRTTNAAAQISALIKDSVSKVENGYKLATDTENMMKEIVVAIDNVNRLISDINKASEEQSASIVQVNAAIGQMDEVTQRNAALVEESAAAAKNVEQETFGLVETVSAFKTNTTLDMPEHREPLRLG